jgi:hypothetical protein
MIDDLDSKEKYLGIIRDKEQQLVSELEAKYAISDLKRDRVTNDEENDDKLNQVLRDIEAFNRF